MAKQVKEIGSVVPLSGPFPGYAARVVRYGDGRKLPAPRLLLDASHNPPRPFTDPYHALDALNVWKRTPRAVKALKPDTPAPIVSDNLTQTHHPLPILPVVNHALDIDEKILARRRRKARQLKRNRDREHVKPEIVKLLPERPPQVLTSRRNATDGYAVTVKPKLKVTRYEECYRPHWNRKHGGVLPAHLDPRTIEEQV